MFRVLAVVAAVVMVSSACAGSGLSDPVIVPRPIAYRVLYRVTTTAGGPANTNWEELAVRRPFAARDAKFADRPGTGGVTFPESGSLTSTNTLYDLRTDGIAAVSDREPGPGTGDQALLVNLDEAVARGLATRGRLRRVAGRVCRDARYLEPAAGAIKALASTGHDDICIDGAGLVLREEWVLGDNRVLLREAVQVDTSGAGLDTALSTASAAANPSGRHPEVVAVNPSWSVVADPPTPSGFTASPAEGFRFPDVQSQSPEADLYEATVWTFTRGPDVVTVEAGLGGPGFVPWSTTDDSRQLTLGALGAATSVLRSDGAEVRVTLPDGRWVRVRGTIPLAELISYSRSLPGPVQVPSAQPSSSGGGAAP